MTDLFPCFRAEHVPTPDGPIFARIGGAGPPLLLLHGYPETHAMWHRVAPALARHFTIVAADLRGYGRSFVAPTAADHHTYGKRAMAADMLAVMTRLGFPRFAVMGHDRGARVSYRLLLDAPEAVTRAVLLDIMTTADLWTTLDRRSALRMYHWLFLAQPAPLPERLVGADARDYLEGRFRRGAAALPAWIEPPVLDDYWQAFRAPERLHAMCEDYRASAGIDLDHDLADRAAGRTIRSALMILWGRRGNLTDCADPLSLWRPWCPHVVGGPIESGHFIPEENPDALLAATLPFLLG